MSFAVTRRILGTLAVLGASACTLGMAASAQAVTIASPDISNGYTNNVSPVITFTGATFGDTVTLTSSADTVSGGDGSTTADTNGDGTITPTNPLATGPNDFVALTLTETNGGTLVGDASVNVNFDTVPGIGGPSDGETIDASDVSFEATSAIPNDEVQTVFTPVGGPGSPMTVSDLADGNGNIIFPSAITPASPLAPNDYSITMTTLDSNNVASDPTATQDFFVAPAEPLITSPADQDNVNQSAPDVTVSGVLAGATVDLYTLDSNSQPELLDEITNAAAGNVTFTSMSPDLADGFDALYAAQTITENGVQISSDGGTSANTPQNGEMSQINVNVDTAAPVLGAETVDDGATTSDNQPFFEATNGPDSTNGNSGVEFFLTGPNGPVNSGMVPTDGGGNANWQPTTGLPDGSYTMDVRSVDSSGNVGAAVSNSMSFTVDTTAPSMPTVVSPANGSTVTTGSPMITVNGDAGTQMCAYVDIEQNDEQDLTCQTSDGNGNATFTLSSALSNGQHTLLVTSSDEVDNTSQNNTTFTVAIPTTTPPTATPTPAPTPTPTPKPAPAPKAPKAVTLSSHTLSAAHPIKLGFSLSKPGTVTVKLIRTVHGKSKVVGTVLLKIKKAGKHSIRLTTRFAGHKLGNGSYTLSLQAGKGKDVSKAVKTKLTVR